MSEKIKEFTQSFFHGTKADLKPGDLIVPGYNSNYVSDYESKYVYLTSNLIIAIWGAELAKGEGIEQIYIVEPTGPIEDDPNVTNKRFPGNPTRSFRAKDPLQVVAKVTDWQGHTIEEIKIRKESLEKLMQNGGSIIED